jgi:hypothetical protein
MNLKPFKPRSRLSHTQLLVFALFFALVGGFLLYKSFALNPNLPGDVNNDNTVNITDLSILLSNYNQNYQPADFNSDGTVSILDLSILLSNYNKTYSGGGGTTAQIFISPSGNDNNNCTSSSPCRTLGRAYAAAATGNTILIANGSYPGDTLTGTKTVTLRVASGGTATLTNTLVLYDASNITVYGPIDTSPAYDINSAYYGLKSDGCSSNLEFHDISGRTFDIDGSSDNIRIYGGSWGGYTVTPEAGDSVIAGWGPTYNSNRCGDGGTVTNILVDGTRFHDVLFTDSSTWGGAHPDCLESYGFTNGVTVRNSTFERCGNTFIGWYTDFGSNFNLVIENNLFHDVTRSTYYGIQIGAKPGFDCGGMVFRYNTYDPNNPNAAYPHAPPLINCPSGQQIYGNIFRQGEGNPNGTCGVGTWAYNVWEIGPTCGSNSVSGQAGFVARGTDYHLDAGAFAIGKGDPSRFPSADFEGTARSSPPDAGYDER